MEKLAKTPNPSIAEQKSLLPLAVAHQASLSNLLKKKESLRGKFNRFENRMAEKEAELKADLKTLVRAVKISDKIDARGAEQHAREIAELTKQFDIHWEGDPQWKEIILEGNTIGIPDELFDNPFPKGGRLVVDSAISDAPAPHQLNVLDNVEKRVKAQEVRVGPDLLEDLDKRVKAQEARIERWKSFRKEMISSAPEDSRDPESIKRSENEPMCGGIDGPRRGSSDGPRLGAFDGPRHGTFNEPLRSTLDDPSLRPGAVTERVEKYEKLTRLINKTLADSNRPSEVSLGLEVGKPASLLIRGQNGFNEALKLQEKNPNGAIVKTLEGNEEVADAHAQLDKDCAHVRCDEKSQSCAEGAIMCSNGSETHPRVASVLTPEKKSNLLQETSETTAEQLVQSTISGPCSSLKLPLPPKHQPSLVERTRESMALAKAEDKIESGTTQSDSCSALPIRAPNSLPSGSSLNLTGSETLIERTRKSMSLLPVKSRAPRTSMLKRPSKVYPTNPFGTPKKSHEDAPGFSTPPEELFSQNAKYASVFKSRPKIALSPAQSPSVSCMDVLYESGNGRFEEDDVGEGTASSPSKHHGKC